MKTCFFVVVQFFKRLVNGLKKSIKVFHVFGRRKEPKIVEPVEILPCLLITNTIPESKKELLLDSPPSFFIREKEKKEYHVNRQRVI